MAAEKRRFGIGSAGVSAVDHRRVRLTAITYGTLRIGRIEQWMVSYRGYRQMWLRS